MEKHVRYYLFLYPSWHKIQKKLFIKDHFDYLEKMFRWTTSLKKTITTLIRIVVWFQPRDLKMFLKPVNLVLNASIIVSLLFCFFGVVIMADDGSEKEALPTTLRNVTIDVFSGNQTLSGEFTTNFSDYTYDQVGFSQLAWFIHLSFQLKFLLIYYLMMNLKN